MGMHSRASRARLLVGLIFSVALVAGGIVAGAPAAGASPGWSVVPSPSPTGPTNGQLSAMSCPSPTSCVAVGSYTSPLAEHWDGTRWSIMGAQRAGTFSLLSGVFCPTTSSCFAVGYYSSGSTTKTLIEHWNGASWSIVASPNPSGSTYDVLRSVTCRGDTNCFAVGDHASGPTHTTLIEHWDGTAWSIVASPNPGDATSSYLNGVRCPLTTNCVAVGYYETTSDNKTLVESWDGTSWSIIASPTPAGKAFNHLTGLACPGPTTCFAVGDSGDGFSTKPLIERWDGTTWSIMAGPTFMAVQVHLSDVKCLSATSCLAVGARGSNTLIERWNGTAWSVVASPNASGAGSSELNAVWCFNESSCNAVGDGAEVGVLAEHWNGTSWSVAPNALGSSQSTLDRVACPSTTNCMAVGNYSTGSVLKSLAERWNGTRWSIVNTPNPGSLNSVLTGVSCPSTTNCYAVGYFTNANAAENTFVMSWDGTTWSVMTSPNATGQNESVLSGVACSSATSCKAVGYSVSSTGTVKTLVEHWNGTSWSIVASPNSSGNSVLASVACPSATSCNAVGSSSSGGVSLTFVEHWNGTTWSIVPSPNPSGYTFASLNDVACSSTTSCNAVGEYATNSPMFSTLVEHWNGTTWAIVASPNPADGATLSGISCPSATDCYAVGDFRAGSPSYTFAEQWNGTSWAIVSTPNPPSAGAGLLAVACPAPTTCFAVGRYSTNVGAYTLVEKYA